MKIKFIINWLIESSLKKEFFSFGGTHPINILKVPELVLYTYFKDYYFLESKRIAD